MKEKELEFRGINLEHLKMYLEEIGGRRTSDSFPVEYDGDNWSAIILREEEIAFTAVFKVNAVFIRFLSDHEGTLDDVLRTFRLKTLRAGG